MSASKLAALDGVLVGDRVVVGPYFTAPMWVALAVVRASETQVATASMRFRRSDGRQIGAGASYQARPETAEERTDRESRERAEATITRALHIRDARLDRVSTAQLVAIAAVCEVTP